MSFMSDRGRLVIATLVCAAVLGLLAATSTILPMAWDEANAINRAAGVSAWFGELGRDGWQALGQAALPRHWHYTVEIEGHPALYGVLIAAGQWLAGEWVAPLTAARVGPMMLFSLATGAVFHRLLRQYSIVAAVGAVAALLTMPRLFAHAHFASFDGPLTSCWMLAWAMFPTMTRTDASATLTLRQKTSDLGRAPHEVGGQCPPYEEPRWRFGLVWAILWGATLGATMSCKFTGWLAPLPFVGYAVVYGDRKTTKSLAIGLATALATFWLFNPRLWHHPLHGLATFFDLNLNRAGTHLEIPTMFFGRRYDMQSPLPWYNTLVWTAITVPLGLFVLAVVGMASVLRRWAVEPQGMLLFGNWLVLVAAKALPGTPVHDAERLILPSFAFFAALAGVGTARLLAWTHGSPGPCGRTIRHSIGGSPGPCGLPANERDVSRDMPPEGGATTSHDPRNATEGSSRNATEGVPYRSRNATEGVPGRMRWRECVRWIVSRAQGPGLPVRGAVMTAVVMGYAAAAANMVWYAPQWLSYYSPAIGGLRGADSAGLEATYYWDALDGDVLDWLHAHTGDGDKIEFSDGPTDNLALMRKWGVLRRGWRREDPGQYRWYVIQRRPTFWQPHDRWLVEHEPPAFAKTIRPPSRGIGPWRLDLPLILIYSAEQRARADAAVGATNGDNVRRLD